MVLKKIGEFRTIINVNGTERVNQLQSSDETYNISEVFTTNIDVNGTQEGSFSQSSDSTYNVSVSGDNFTFQPYAEREFQAEGRYSVIKVTYGVELDYSFNDITDTSDFSGYSAYINGTQVDIFNLPETGTISAGNEFHLELESTGPNTVIVDLDLTLKPNGSATGVTKS